MQLFTDSSDYAEGSIGLVEYVANLLNDRTKQQWSKAEIITWINQEQFSLGSRINRLCRDFFLTSATTPVVADQTLYSLPSDLVSGLGFEIADDSADREPQPLVEIPMEDRFFYQALDKANLKSEFGYVYVAGTTFRFMPEGSSSAAGKLIRVHYVKRLSAMTTGTAISEIPEQHHELLALGAVIRALAKKPNPERLRTVTELYTLRMDDMKGEILVKQPLREDRIEPWWGTYGPEMPFLTEEQF